VPSSDEAGECFRQPSFRAFSASGAVQRQGLVMKNPEIVETVLNNV
jgi:hypothetical protein